MMGKVSFLDVRRFICANYGVSPGLTNYLCSVPYIVRPRSEDLWRGVWLNVTDSRQLHSSALNYPFDVDEKVEQQQKVSDRLDKIKLSRPALLHNGAPVSSTSSFGLFGARS